MNFKFYALALLAALGGAGMQMKAAFSETSQLAGNYNLTYYDLIDNKNTYEYTHFTLTQGEAPNEMFLEDLYFIYGLKVPVTVDFEAGTITFTSVDDVFYMENYQGMANFELFKWNAAHTRYSKVETATATLLKNGTGSFVFDPETIISVRVPDGVNPSPGMGGGESGRGEQVILLAGSYSNNAMTARAERHEWIYFEEEWKEAGAVDFTDGWIAPFAGYNAPGKPELTYERSYYQNIQNPAIYLVLNPYGYGTIWKNEAEIGEEFYNYNDEQGYIYIDTTNPNFVYVIGGVPAGYSSLSKQPTEKNSSGQWIDHQLVDFKCMNEEGYNYWSTGMDEAYIKSVMVSFGMGTYSTKKGDDIEIRNLDFSIVDDAYSWWDPDVYTSKFTLYPGKEAGVKSVMNVAPGEKAYYNLQGQKVINPQPGQLLIEISSEGSKKILISK